MRELLSDYHKQIFEFVNFMTICDIVSLFGIGANIVNVIIFYKQGFSNTVNIAFLGLALSDFCSLVMLLWSTICLNPFLETSTVPWLTEEVMYLSGAWPHICFCRITSFITVYITAERYLCIAFPLKVKEIVSARKTTVIICLIYLVNIVVLVPEYATSYLDWRFVSERNKTLVGIIFTSTRSSMEGLIYVFHSLLSTSSFVGVVSFTVLLVHKLRLSSQWRNNVISNLSQFGSMSAKDKRTVKMIVLVATILIVCYLPGAAISMTAFIVGPEFSIRGRYINLCVAAWSIAFCFQSVNSSVNIFLYYRMSANYRQTFDKIFPLLVSSCFRGSVLHN